MFRRFSIAVFLCLCCFVGLESASAAPERQDLLHRSAWRPVASAPPPRIESDGVRFDLPFARQSVDRFYWDADVRLDLSGTTALALELSCDRPEALRSLAVYFQSGEGWYIWNKPIPRPGRQMLRMARSEFSTEGNPAGWDRITRVRLSPWRGGNVDTQLVVHAFQARTVPVLVIQGTLSASGAAERRVAETVTRRVSGWLEDMGIAHAVLPEEAVSETDFSGARTIILPYNVRLPDRVRTALMGFVRRGGRLVVCYSSDARLAEFMGFRLGEYTRADRPGRWTSFRFEDPAAWETPERILQQSVHILPAWPASRDAQVIAWWEDAEGRAAPEPAWVAGSRGLWMSHVLRPDDGLGKPALLAGLLVTLDPGLWPDVADALSGWSGRIDSFSGYAEAVAAIRRAARGMPGERRILDLLAEALRLQARLERRRETGEYRGFLSEALRLRAALTEAYARVQKPFPGEFRGLWDHSGAGWFPGDWERSAALLADHGITALFPNLLWAGRAHFPSESLPGSNTLRRHGDQARACVDAARNHGIQVHAWKVCWSLAVAPAELIESFRKAGRLQEDAQGRTTTWLCPAHPDNIEYELEGLRELVRNYAPDGVHLDYIRYPDRDHCYCSTCRRGFERRGRRVRQWPADVLVGGPRRAEYEAWRRDTLTAFLQRLRGELRALHPSIQLSAAVFGGHEDARMTIGQDWMEWLRQGLLDFVVPMNYTDNLSYFTSLVRRQFAAAGPLAGRIYPGIGVTSNEAALAPDQVIEQIVRGREHGARGFVLFDLNADIKDQTLPALRLGLTRE